MKACLMRVHYDPRYTSPHHTSTLQTRLALTHDIYGSGPGIDVHKTLKDTLEEAAARKKTRQKLLQKLRSKTSTKDRDTDSLHPSLLGEIRPKERPRSVRSLTLSESVSGTIDSIAASSPNLPLSEGWTEEETYPRPRRDERQEEGRRKHRYDQHKEGVAAAHSSLKPGHRMKSTTPPAEKGPTDRTPRVKKKKKKKKIKRSYGERLLKRQQSINALSVQARNRYSSPTKQIGASHDNAISYYNRSRTVPSFGDILSKKSAAKIELEKRARREAERAIKDKKVFTIMGPYHSLRQALRRRGWVERFINAPPPGDISIRRKPIMNTTDSDDDDGFDRKENFTPPWEEENGFYGMMSYLARNITPSLIFAVRTVDVETRKGGQLVNHFGKARHFTTKLGLCQNLREVPWYETADPDEFYPRCFRLEEDEEKQAFIDDFHTTAAVGFIKWFVEKYDGITVGDEEEEEKKTLNAIVTSMMSTTQALGNDTDDSVTRPLSQAATDVQSLNADHSKSQPNSATQISKTPNSPTQINKTPNSPTQINMTPNSATEIDKSLNSATEISKSNSLHVNSDPKHDSQGKMTSPKRKSSLPPVLPVRGTLSAVSHSASTTSSTVTAVNASPPASPSGSVMGRFLYHRSGKTMKAKYYHMAVTQCEQFIRTKEHDDIDVISNSEDLTNDQWDQFLDSYYTFVHEDADFVKVTGAMVRYCKTLLAKIEQFCPQYTLDGYRNVWIVKPGAKSRGRGIQCDDRLDKLLGMIQTGDSDDKLVAQKYIERPFLVYNTKFDIRQWFLVTDWQPLTVWFYKSCYLRFCSQNFTLENFHESIHLSNNSVQKHYNNSNDRSDKLPKDNMWTSDEFDEFLKNRGHGDIWKEVVVPGMKSALVCALLCTQELVEVRKSAFELYGADFMLTDDLKPWLIEINSSPSMARNTRATCQLVDAVLEDTLKVVLDRRRDRSADTGDFECIYKQSYVSDPRPPDMDLSVSGRKIRKKHFTYTPHKGPVPTGQSQR